MLDSPIDLRIKPDFYIYMERVEWIESVLNMFLSVLDPCLTLLIKRKQTWSPGARVMKSALLDHECTRFLCLNIERPDNKDK